MYCILHSICAYMRSFGMQLLLVHQSFEGFFPAKKKLERKEAPEYFSEKSLQ